MAVPNLYITHQNNSGNVQVHELVGGTSETQIGNNVTGASVETQGDEDFPANNVIEFAGSRYLWHANTIREENTTGTGDWGSVFTTSQVDTDTENFATHSGLFLVHPSGVPTMVGMAIEDSSAADTVLAIKTTDGSTFSENTGNAISIGAAGFVGPAIDFDNKLFWILSEDGANDTVILVYDPATDTIVERSVESTVSSASFAFCPAGGKLYMAGIPSSTGSSENPSLYELIGQEFKIVNTFTELQRGTSGHFGKPALFSNNGTDLVFIVSGQRVSDLEDGDLAFEITDPGTGSQTVTERTSALIPSEFQPTGAQASNRSRYYVFIDNENSSSVTSPDIYVWRLANSTTGNYEFFSFTDTTTTLSSGGTGPTFEFTFFENVTGGSDRISAGASSTTNKIYAEVENPTASSTAGAMDVSFRAYGSSTGLTATAYFTTNRNQVSTQATLVGTVSGGTASRSGNTIIDVDADDGATLYTFTWDATTDSVSQGEKVNFTIDLV